MIHDTLDPLAALEAAARRQQAQERALKDLSHARARLVLGRDAQSVFLATLALRLRAEASWDIDTAATDGRRLLVNPDWFCALPPAERIGVVAHEVLHPAMQHHARRGQRDPRRWNVAADAAINPLLREAGYSLPASGLFPGEGPLRDLPPNLSAEEYYAMLDEDAETGAGGDGDSSGRSSDPGGCGQVLDAAADQAGQAAAESEWQVAVAQARQAAKERGKLPAGLARLVDEVLEPKVDWRSVLREFLSRSLAARDDYSWSVPNRRFVAQGIYLPSLRSESMGEVVLAVDTSGSIDQAMLAEFAAEAAGILECRPCQAHVVFCDAAVQRVDQWSPSDGPLTLSDAPGGGGTSHVPVWDWLRESGVDAACVVCLTDGYTDWGADPGMPVLWALTSEAAPPFGQAIRLEARR